MSPALRLIAPPLDAPVRDVAREAVRLLVVRDGAEPTVQPFDAFASLFGPGDLLVLNDAATFPGSLRFRRRGVELELRLFEKTPRGFKAVLFGPGDHRTRTEHRAPPPHLHEGETVELAGLSAVVAHVSPLSPRLLELEFAATDEQQWSAVYRHGAPIQYAHHPTLMALWQVQNAYAERPWAAEMPSAGRPLTFSVLDQVRRRGARVATLTHATGLSATGDDALDRALPWPERFEIPTDTLAALRSARRVFAAGTSVMRAIEASAESGFTVGSGVVERAIDEHTLLHRVDALLTGIHSPGESHYRLLRSLVSQPTLERASAAAADEGLQPHELGDSALFFRRDPTT